MKDRPILFGSLLAGLLASACCIGPLVLGAIGLGSLGFAAWLAPARPWFLGFTTLLLAIGFYLAYRPMRAHCEPGEECKAPRSRRSQRIMLWSVTLIAVGLATYPSWAARRSNADAVLATRTTSDAVVTLDVQGMTCDACATEIESGLREVPGVVQASVDYEHARAQIVVGNASFDPNLLIAAVEKAGYRASIPASKQSTKRSQASPGLSGQWRGRMTVDEEGKTAELIVDLERVGDRWTGQFDLPDFGVEDYPVEVGLSGSMVTLQLSAAQVEFMGQFKAPDALAGMSESQGHRDSLVLRWVGKARLSAEFLRLEALSEDSTRLEQLSASGVEIRRQFNEDRAFTRLVMLLSPT